jgi:hypothetical protein
MNAKLCIVLAAACAGGCDSSGAVGGAEVDAHGDGPADAAGDGPLADATTDAASVTTATDASTPMTDAGSPGMPGPGTLDGAVQGEPCNGDPAVCGVGYDSVAFPTAHAAMAYAFPPFACPAQDLTVRSQLDRGVRALDLEVHTTTDLGDGAATLALCRGDCASGELPASVALSDVSAFLAVNPREIVTLLFEGGADAGQLEAALVAAGLDGVAWSPGDGGTWPTLQQMITAGTRVVVLADVTGSPPPWMLPLWTEVAETGRAFVSPASMTCDITRGSPSAPLLLLNELLVDGEGGSTGAGGEGGLPLGPGCDDPALAQVVNAEPFFKNRVAACQQQRGRKPTFVSVDFFEDGDLSGAIRALND